MSLYSSVIDTDIHPMPLVEQVLSYLAEPWRPRLVGGNRGAGHLGYWNPNEGLQSDATLPDGTPIASSPAATSAHFLDAHHIEYGILNATLFMDTAGLSPDLDYGARLIAAVNDVIINEWLPVDSRYYTSILIAPGDPQQAVDEIHRVGDHPKVVQVLLPSGIPMPLGNRFYHPIFAAAAEHNLPVAIHPGSEGVGVSGPPTAAGYPANYLEWHTGLVGSLMTHFISMVTEGVFIKFPRLKFIMIEGGAMWLPPLLWRLDKNWKGLRIMTPWLDRLPSEIAQEHILLTTQPLEEPPHSQDFQMMLEMFDAENIIMFSSNYPHWDGDMPDLTARSFPAKMRPKIMSENARQLYSLPETNNG